MIIVDCVDRVVMYLRNCCRVRGFLGNLIRLPSIKLWKSKAPSKCAQISGQNIIHVHAQRNNDCVWQYSKLLARNQQFYSPSRVCPCPCSVSDGKEDWHLLGPGKGFKLYACFDCTVAASKISAVLQNDYDGIIKASRPIPVVLEWQQP